MGERHLHFNVLTLMWLYVGIIVVSNAMKYVFANKLKVSGLSELVAAT